MIGERERTEKFIQLSDFIEDTKFQKIFQFLLDNVCWEEMGGEGPLLTQRTPIDTGIK